MSFYIISNTLLTVPYHHKNEWARNAWPEFGNDYYEQKYLDEPFLTCPFGPTSIPISRGHEINLERQYGKDWFTHAYMQLNHKTEISFDRIKVKVTPGRKTNYILPDQN